MCRGPRVTRAAGARLAVVEVGGGHRLRPRRGHRSGRRPHPVAAFGATTADRHSIGRVVPGCAAYAEKVARPGGFVLPRPPRDTRTFPTPAGTGISPSARPRCCTSRRAGSCCSRCAATTSTTPPSTASRPLPRHPRRSSGRLHHPPTSPTWLRRRPARRPRQRVGRRLGRSAPTVPGRAVRHAARVRRRVLPGDEPAGPAGLHGDREQLPDVEVGDRPTGHPTRPRGRWRRVGRGCRRLRRRPQVRRGAVPPQLSGMAGSVAL